MSEKPQVDRPLTEHEQKLLASTRHDALTAELHAAAAAEGITPAALAQSPQWRQRLNSAQTEHAESAEPAKVARREKRRSP